MSIFIHLGIGEPALNQDSWSPAAAGGRGDGDGGGVLEGLSGTVSPECMHTNPPERL